MQKYWFWLGLCIFLTLSGCGVSTHAAVASLGASSHQRAVATTTTPASALPPTPTPIALPTPATSDLAARVASPFALSAQQPRAALAEAGLTVQFDRVLEDSRCPEGARCIWAGRAVAQLTLSDGAVQQSFEVVLGGVNRLDAPAAAAFGPYLVSLVEVTPYPQVGSQLATQTVTVLVERRP